MSSVVDVGFGLGGSLRFFPSPSPLRSVVVDGSCVEPRRAPFVGARRPSGRVRCTAIVSAPVSVCFHCSRRPVGAELSRGLCCVCIHWISWCCLAWGLAASLAVRRGAALPLGGARRGAVLVPVPCAALRCGDGVSGSRTPPPSARWRSQTPAPAPTPSRGPGQGRPRLKPVGPLSPAGLCPQCLF